MRTRLAISPETVIDDPIVLVPARRWKLDDFDNWFLGRLNDRWPGYHENTWRGKLANLSGSNDHLFVTNGESVLLCEVKSHAITARPLVMEVFGWSRDSLVDRSGRTGNWVPEDGRHLLALYRHAKTWAEGMKAVRLIAGTCSDLNSAKLKQHFTGEYLLDVLL